MAEVQLATIQLILCAQGSLGSEEQAFMLCGRLLFKGKVSKVFFWYGWVEACNSNQQNEISH